MKKLLILGLIPLLFACNTTKRVERKCQKWGCVKDTAYIKETVTNTVLKDTTVFIHIPGEVKHDSVEIVLWEECPKAYTPKNTLETSLAYSQAWVENGRLRHTLVQRDSVYKAQIENAIRISQYFVKENSIKVLTKRVHYLTWWDRFFRNSGYVFWVASILVAIALYFLNRFIYK